MKNGPVENQIKIGLIGCGRWGKFILRDLVSLGAEVHVVIRSENTEANAKEFGARYLVKTIDQLPQSLDGFVVATPTSTHFEVVSELVKYDKPIFVEKPFSPSSKDALSILQKSDKVFVMHKWRYHPGIQKIKEYIDSQELGKVLSIKATRNQWGSPHKDVNTVWIHLPHDLSIIWHFLERVPPLIHSTLVRAKSKQVMGAVAIFEDDVLCTIEHNACVVEKDRSLSIHFENGGIELTDPLENHLILRRGQPDERSPVEKISIDTEYPLLRQLGAFLDFIKKPQSKTLHSNLNMEIELIRKIEEVLVYRA